METKSPIATGSTQLDEQEARRLREREEAGLEPEQHPGPRQNEGISTTGQLLASAEDVPRSPRSENRADVDRKAAHVLGDAE